MKKFKAAVLCLLVLFSPVTDYSQAADNHIYLPTNYQASQPAPLVIALHGYAQSALQFEKYWQFKSQFNSAGFIYAVPNGSADSSGNYFWNATPECCDFQTPKVDDQAYLRNYIATIENQYSVDPKRIYLIGHSNGGFMANAFACKNAKLLAAVVNIAGGSYGKQSLCQPSAPINLLQIWGTKDETYPINHIMGMAIPGAVKTIQYWARLNGCQSQAVALPQKFDFDASIKGAETTVLDYPNCANGKVTEFWRMAGSNHQPKPTPAFKAALVQFFASTSPQ